MLSFSPARTQFVFDSPRDDFIYCDSESDERYLRTTIPVTRDDEGQLSSETLLKILDKRSTIGGVRQKRAEFQKRRREVFDDKEHYKEVIKKYLEVVE